MQATQHSAQFIVPSVFVFYGPGGTGKSWTARTSGAYIVTSFNQLAEIPDGTECICFDAVDLTDFPRILAYIRGEKVPLINGKTTEPVFVKCTSNRIIFIFNYDPRSISCSSADDMNLRSIPDCNYFHFNAVK